MLLLFHGNQSTSFTIHSAWLAHCYVLLCFHSQFGRRKKRKSKDFEGKSKVAEDKDAEEEEEDEDDEEEDEVRVNSYVTCLFLTLEIAIADYEFACGRNASHMMRKKMR